MWTASHAANAPSEDRSSSLVNVLLRPLNESFGGDSQHSLIRLSLWSVIDGHGGGCVATYVAEVLLPHIAASVSRSLDCEIVDRGEFRVNDELRDANAIDFEGLIRSSETSHSNRNSIHYRSPRDEEADDDGSDDHASLSMGRENETSMADDCDGDDESEISLASSLLPRDDVSHSVESVKTSVKTASPARRSGPTGTHSTDEVARATQAITESFCAVDEGWINSIDVATTRQMSCQTNGAWNAGACALVVFTMQRLDWTSNPTADQDLGGADATGGQDTCHNRDAARLRMLDYASKGKSASSISTVSSTSSLTKPQDHATESAFESENTETEDDEEQHMPETANKHTKHSGKELLPQDESLISTPGGCGCHAYRPHDAMLYTAHVGDCRAVLLGNAPPRTIKLPPDGACPVGNNDTTDDDSSYHSSDETEQLSSSEHDEDSSDDESGYRGNSGIANKMPPHMRYMTQPARRMLITRENNGHKPFVALPPLNNKEISCSSDASESSDDEQPARKISRKDPERVNEGNKTPLGVHEQPPLLHLASLVRPIDLTTDHSAYNPAEVAAVLRRCNNAPKAISAGFGGGIRRVAGSLAVTRALGDAYLKTPLLSFFPYKSHAPYITARPEVNCRLLPRDDPKTNKVLVLATDGVWERASGEDVLRWVRNYAEERIADAERRSSRCRESNTAVETTSPESARNKKATKKRKMCPRRRSRPSKNGASSKSTAADVIVRRVLNKVRRSRNMNSLQDLIALPKGRARRSKHDDM